MKFRIHFTYPNGTEDSLVVEGDDLPEMREQVSSELSARGITGDELLAKAWSEEI